MSSQSREKIALVVFGALIVLSLCGLIWYLFAGHSWNVAASNIDDTFGSMDGYTAIAYAGTTPVEVEDKDEVEGPSKPLKDAGAVGASTGLSAPSGLGAAGAGKKATAKDDEAADAAAGTTSDAATDAAADAPDTTPDAADKATAEDSTEKPLSVDDVKKNYEGKAATVFSLDTLQPDTYSEGNILKKGGHRFGVFSITKPTSARLIEKQVAYFTEHEVDFIVVLTSDKSFVADTSGIDIVISTQDEGVLVMGESVDGTFYVDAPELGKVGVILISPSNVVSAKVIEEL